MPEWAWALAGAGWICAIYALLRLLPMRLERERFEVESDIAPDELVSLLADPLVEAWMAAPLALQEVGARRTAPDGVEYRMSRYRVAAAVMDHVMVEVVGVDRARHRIDGCSDGPHLRLRATMSLAPRDDGGTTIRYESQRRRRLVLVPASPDGAVQHGWQRQLDALPDVPDHDTIRAVMRDRLLGGVAAHHLLLLAISLALGTLSSAGTWFDGLAWGVGAVLAHEALRLLGGARRARQGRADVESLRVPSIT